MATSAFDLAALTVSNPVTSAKGAKTAAVSYKGKPIVWQPEAQTVVSEPTAFQNDDAVRVNLVMRTSSHTAEVLSSLDTHLIEFCTEHSARLFGKTLSRDEVALRYSPCLKQSAKGGYDPTFKTKIVLSGRGKLRCWDSERTPCEFPESWVGCTVQPHITFRCLWIMPKEFGCLFDCSDALIDETGPECPF